MFEYAERVAGAQRDALVAMGDRHLRAMELERRVFIKARALSLAQRLMLYARDELEMAVRSSSGVLSCLFPTPGPPFSRT